MTARALLRRHAGLFTCVVVLELVVAWVAARVAVVSLRRNFPLHPDGLDALFRDGGRGAVDLVLGGRPERIFATPVLAVAIAVAGYFLVTRVIETLVASAFATDRRSLRPFFRVLLVHLVVAVGFGTLGFAGWLGVTGTRDLVVHWYDRRAADLVIVASMIPAFVVAMVLLTVDDLAVLRSGGGHDLLTAFGDALARVRATPARLVGGRVVLVIASAVLILVGAAFSWSAERDFGALVFVCIVMQQLCAASRIVLRLGWLAQLATFWRAD